jgi:hypothetical protein
MRKLQREMKVEVRGPTYRLPDEKVRQGIPNLLLVNRGPKRVCSSTNSVSANSFNAVGIRVVRAKPEVPLKIFIRWWRPVGICSLLEWQLRYIAISNKANFEKPIGAVVSEA